MDSIRLDAPEPQLDGRPILQLIERFIEDKRSEVVERTLRGYQEKLVYWFEFWEVHGPGAGYIITPSMLKGFEEYLRERRSKHNGQPLGFNTRADALKTG